MDFDLNDPKTWDDNAPNPSPEAQARFQERLDSIVGVELDGTKRWLLAWAPDPKAWIWNRYKERKEPRFEHYWADAQITYARESVGLRRKEKRRKRGIDTVVLSEPIAKPRFFIGGLLPTAHRLPEADLPGVDDFGQRFGARQYLGPEYVTIFTITQHSEVINPETQERACCQDIRERYDLPCIGNFRFPDEKDLEELQELFRLKLDLGLARPDKVYDSYDRERVWATARLSIAREIDRRNAIVANIQREQSLMDFIKVHNRPNKGARKNHISIPGL